MLYIEENSLKNDLSVFLGHKRHYDSLPDEEKDNWCWANFNRVGCARIRNTAIGTLLVNISSGLEFGRLCDCIRTYHGSRELSKT